VRCVGFIGISTKYRTFNGHWVLERYGIRHEILRYFERRYVDLRNRVFLDTEHHCLASASRRYLPPRNRSPRGSLRSTRRRHTGTGLSVRLIAQTGIVCSRLVCMYRHSRVDQPWYVHGNSNTRNGSITLTGLCFRRKWTALLAINQTSHPFKNSVIQRTSSSLVKSNIISITVSTTYFLHPRLPHSATISGDDHTLGCFRNTVDTLWTLTLLGRVEYYTIDTIMKLSTHTLNQWLTDITSLLFIIVVTILRSLKHSH